MPDKPAVVTLGVTADSWLTLAASTVALARVYVPLLNDFLRLCTPELQNTVDQVLTDVLQAQLMQLESALRSDKTSAADVSESI